VGNQRFCSTSCCGGWRSETIKGENHPNYKDNVAGNNYGSNWWRKREEARQRFNYSCGVCGVSKTELETHIHIHHIITIRQFDELEEANFDRNLIALCPSCHKFFEHNDYSEILFGVVSKVLSD